jgi:hypothetical protein
MDIERYMSSRWGFGTSKNPEVIKLNNRYSSIFKYVNDLFVSGDINLESYNKLDNFLMDNYFKERISLVINDGLNKMFNNQLEKMAKSLR